MQSGTSQTASWRYIMVLTILQWNTRSLIANGHEFKQFIVDQENSPDIICVQETWLKPNLDYVINGYISIRKDRNNGNSGGVARIRGSSNCGGKNAKVKT